ncbi:hypothetical protein OAF83_03030 [Rubripirellula sp.]|nr:hypothetical protein [Rubripirellula sp.]
MRSRLGPERASERRACRVLGQPRNTQRYQSRRADDELGLLHEMRLLLVNTLVSAPDAFIDC